MKRAVFLRAALLVERVCMVIHISTFLISINPCRQGWERPGAKALQTCWTSGRAAREQAGWQSCWLHSSTHCVPNAMSMPPPRWAFLKALSQLLRVPAPWPKLIQTAILGVRSQGEVPYPALD